MSQTDAQEAEHLLDVPAVSERLSISIWSTYRLLRNGDLPAVRVGSRVLVATTDLAAFIEQRRAAPRPRRRP